MNDRSIGDKLGSLRDRRAVMAGLVGAGASTVAAAFWVATEGLPFGDDVPPPEKLGERAAANSAAEAGGFANRDASFVADSKAPSPTSLQTKLYSSASEAARLTPVTVATVLAKDQPVPHLLRRTTFGPTPALIGEVDGKGIDAWLAEQLKPADIADDEADAVWAATPLVSMSPAEIHAAIEPRSWDAMLDYGKAVMGRQIWSKRQLYEVVVDFWANHLNVTVPSASSWDTGGPYHNDVIRKHALGSFTDMLVDAIRHPAMLRYLSNSTSTKQGVNENLGRELLELHTVGVGSGYTEADVRSSAYILTGRTETSDMGGEVTAEFLYDAPRHWTGAVKVLDFQHENASGEGGMEVGDAYLRYLAAHPATARTIATKLAVRFVADAPPPTLVERLAKTYLDNGTRILPVLDVLFRSGEFWANVGQKTRRPLEDIIAAARVIELRPGDAVPAALERFYWYASQMSHAPLGWLAPNGYPDVQPAWRSTSTQLQLWNYHRALLRAEIEGTSPTPPRQLVADQPQANGAELVDSLCRRFCFPPLQPHHREALVAFAGAAPSDARVAELAALLLDSPYSRLR